MQIVHLFALATAVTGVALQARSPQEQPAGSLQQSHHYDRRIVDPEGAQLLIRAPNNNDAVLPIQARAGKGEGGAGAGAGAAKATAKPTGAGAGAGGAKAKATATASAGGAKPKATDKASGKERI